MIEAIPLPCVEFPDSHSLTWLLVNLAGLSSIKPVGKHLPGNGKRLDVRRSDKAIRMTTLGRPSPVLCST